MDTGITIQDIQQLQHETSEAENIQRLRAIAAERKIRELDAQVKELQAALALATKLVQEGK